MTYGEIFAGVTVLLGIGGLIGGYYRINASFDKKIQHLEDTTEKKDGLGEQMANLSLQVALVLKDISYTKETLEEIKTKISTLPCSNPKWKGNC